MRTRTSSPRASTRRKNSCRRRDLPAPAGAVTSTAPGRASSAQAAGDLVEQDALRGGRGGVLAQERRGPVEDLAGRRPLAEDAAARAQRDERLRPARLDEPGAVRGARGLVRGGAPGMLQRAEER